MATLSELLRAGYTPPTDSVLADPIKEHFRTLPQQLATNQAAMDKTMNGLYKTDLGTGQPNPNYYPEAMQEFTQLMPNMAGMIAYHGTPHNIAGKFDINKVGTGEGAQHFGHGIYYAEEPNIAAGYTGRTVITEPKLEKFTFNGPDYSIENGKYYKNNTKIAKADYEKAFEGITDLFNTQNKGNLYKVDIPDAEIPHYMDWYTKLDEQTPQVKKALGIPETEFEHFKIPQSGTNYSFSPKMSGQNLYHELTSIMGSKKEASKLLNDIGVKGNRYENMQVKKGRGADTYNYVSFDPSTIDILEKNGVPTRKELIEEQINKIKE